MRVAGKAKHSEARGYNLVSVGEKKTNMDVQSLQTRPGRRGATDRTGDHGDHIF